MACHSARGSAHRCCLSALRTAPAHLRCCAAPLKEERRCIPPARTPHQTPVGTAGAYPTLEVPLTSALAIHAVTPSHACCWRCASLSCGTARAYACFLRQVPAAPAVALRRSFTFSESCSFPLPAFIPVLNICSHCISLLRVCYCAGAIPLYAPCVAGAGGRKRCLPLTPSRRSRCSA